MIWAGYTDSRTSSHYWNKSPSPEPESRPAWIVRRSTGKPSSSSADLQSELPRTCTTIGGTYADTGYTFAITTTADRTAAWSQAITVNFDGLKQFITLYITEAGTSSSVVSCYILHRKNVT
jgi:hypothetical protein